MTKKFHANGLPVLIGSFPLRDHVEGVELVFKYTPEIPLWIQLPTYKEEGMIAQFQTGFPGLVLKAGKFFIDTADSSFDNDILEFYEDYIAVSEGELSIEDSRFAMNTDTARGFFSLIEHLRSRPDPPYAIKGQITGPVTFGLGLTDQNGKAIFYDEQLRDVAIKLLAKKARWQAKILADFDSQIIIFF